MKPGVLEQMKNMTETITQRFSYGLDEISAMTGLSTAFLRKEAKAERLITKKFGARRLVLNEDLQAYLKGENEDAK